MELLHNEFIVYTSVQTNDLDMLIGSWKMFPLTYFEINVKYARFVFRYFEFSSSLI